MPAPTTTSNGRPLGTRPNVFTPISPVLTGTIRIYAVGDSFTQGGSSENDGNTGRSWRQYVAEMLNTSGIPWLPVGHVGSVAPDWPWHRAIFGQSMQETIDDFNNNPSRIPTADPDVVLLCPVGYNELTPGLEMGMSASDALDVMQSLMDIFRSYTNNRGFSPRIVSSFLPQRSGGTVAGRARIDDFNNLLMARIDAQRALGQVIGVVDPRPALDRSAFRADGFHPKDSGFRLYSDVIFPVLLNLIGMNAEWGRPSS